MNLSNLRMRLTREYPVARKTAEPHPQIAAVLIVLYPKHNKTHVLMIKRGLELKVHPGEKNETEFFARNPTTITMTAQAVPSVTPFYAAEYLHKTECFCFDQQQLAGGEALDLPLRFIIDQDLPAEVTTLTLSYTLFDITEQVSKALAVN